MKIIFTVHAKDRMKKKKVMRQEVIETIRYPDNILRKYGLYYFQKELERGWIEICCEKREKNIKVITVYLI